MYRTKETKHKSVFTFVISEMSPNVLQCLYCHHQRRGYSQHLHDDACSKKITTERSNQVEQYHTELPRHTRM